MILLKPSGSPTRGPIVGDFASDSEDEQEATLQMLTNVNLDRGETPNVSYLSMAPPAVGTPHRQWYRSLVRARRHLEK